MIPAEHRNRSIAMDPRSLILDPSNSLFFLCSLFKIKTNVSQALKHVWRLRLVD